MQTTDFEEHTVMAVHIWAAQLPQLGIRAVMAADLDRPFLFSRMQVSPAVLSPMRSRVLRWARDQGFGEDQCQDIVLGIDEAATNAVEHANASEMTLFAAADQAESVAHVIISDNGTWRPPPKDPGFRGRGLEILRKLTDRFHVCHSMRGTTYVLSWALS